MRFNLPTFNKTHYFLLGSLFVLATIAIFFGPHFQSMSNFENGSGANAFYMVYADWCPHCKSVKPAMEQFKDDVSNGKIPALKGKDISIELIDGESNSPALSSLPPVKGFPTFFLKSGSNVSEYKGPREVSEMVSFITGKL